MTDSTEALEWAVRIGEDTVDAIVDPWELDYAKGKVAVLRSLLAAHELNVGCGEPLPPEHWTIAMPPCRRTKGHQGIHWFVPDAAYTEAIKEKE